MTDRKRLENLMRDAGFYLHRTGKHLIWRDDVGAQVVTAATASDRRCLLNVERDIRKARALVAA